MSKSWDKGAAPAHILHISNQARGIDWRPNHPTELIVTPFDPLVATAGAVGLTDLGPTGTSNPVTQELPDTCLEVWDVRRHHLAKYILPGAESTAVSAVWNDSDTVMACYQNGGLMHIDLQSRVAPKSMPIETIPRQLVAWSAHGEVAYAIDRFKPGEIPFDDIKAEYGAHWSVGRPRKAVSDAPYAPLQALGVMPFGDSEGAEFAYMAYHTRLEGEKPEKLCKWNREVRLGAAEADFQVAEMCGLLDEARVWDFLQGLIEEFTPTNEGLFNEAVFSQAGSSLFVPQAPSPGLAVGPAGTVAHSVCDESIEGITLEEGGDPVAHVVPDAVDDSASEHSSESDSPQTPIRSRFKLFLPPVVQDAPKPALHRGSTSASALQPNGTTSMSSRSVPKRLGFETPLEDDTPTPIADLDYPDPYGIAAAFENYAPSKTRTARSTPQSTRPPTPSPGDRANGRGSPSVSQLGSARPSVTALTKDRVQPGELTRHIQDTYAPDQWDAYRDSRCAPLLDWWQAYVDDGEMQFATAIFILGSTVVAFPQQQAERVLDAYLDMLERHRLVVPLAYVRRSCGVREALTLPGQEGITHPIYCCKCGKSTGTVEDTADPHRVFWWCPRCRRAAKICSICREPVRGLWMGCMRCRHGGHQRCMRLYYGQ